ncbi:MAG: ABC transporter ATP-binding protein [candidate division Zixibacteria bacterium]|nr:ABC transporter ATP-binding protein [candidate division Zixibacteria bacterium]
MNLSVENVSKQYRGGVWGLRDFTIELESGVLGLVGPNGAGKSTLMRILATISRPTSGTAKWNGKDIAADPEVIRRELGYLPQDFGVYPNLSAVEFLSYVATLKGITATATRRRIDELLTLLNLTAAAKRPLGGFSGGMKQRVGIAQALLNDPRLLIVDEPTVGLDPEERVRFRNLLADLAGERVVLLSTHIVSDVESTASAIAIIAQGRLLVHTTPERLLDSVRDKVWETPVSAEQLSAYRQRFVLSGVQRRDGRLTARLVAPEAPAVEAVRVAASLEDAYLFTISQQRAAA